MFEASHQSSTDYSDLCFRLPPPSGASGNPTAGFGAGNHPHSHSELLNSINPHHPALSPNFLTSPAGFSQQEYLNAAAQRLSEMQASAALDPLNAIEGKKIFDMHFKHTFLSYH